MNKVAVTDEVRKNIFVFFYKQKHLEKKPNKVKSFIYVFMESTYLLTELRKC